MERIRRHVSPGGLLVAILVAGGTGPLAHGQPQPSTTPADPGSTIGVRNPQTLAVDVLPADRVPVGVPDDYKPCIARLPSGELLLVAFHQHQLGGKKIREEIKLFRSRDGGCTWSAGRVLKGLLGREPYLSVLRDGTVLITVHLLPQDIRNKIGHTHSYVHRSGDGGRTWTTTRIHPDGWPAAAQPYTTRNVLELADGSLLLGVSDRVRGRDAILRSSDGGRTWSGGRAARVEGIRKDYPFQFFGEAVLWAAQSGTLYAIARVDSKYFPPLKSGPAPASGSDQFDRMILYTSTDAGGTWKPARDFGDYGEMYPGVLRLKDGRLLLTFTVREVKPPLGVRAVPGREEADGFRFDFAHDRLMIDTKTPAGRASGGGFGRTVQLDDGTLVTSYSYRDAKNATHVEVARWRLPSATASAGQACIIVDSSGNALAKFAAEELKRYLKRLFNVDAPIGPDPVGDGYVFRIEVDGNGLSDQGIRLRPDGMTLTVSGGSPQATLWAVYELVHRWGVRYLVHGDALPEAPGELRLPQSEVVMEPTLRIRCWRLVNELPLGPVSWSREENRRFLHQIAKMKFNRVHLSFWPCQPFVHYRFRGMDKPPAKMFFGWRYPIDADTVGRERFGPMTVFTNPEFVGAESPQELEARAVALARHILEDARKLGMQTGISIQPFEWPKEFMKVLPGSEPVKQAGNLTAGPGKSQPMDDPALREMVATIIRAYVETYPQATYLHVSMPEHRSWIGHAERAYEMLDERYGLAELGSYEELCAKARARTSYPGGGERVETMLKGDLTSIWFFDSLVREKQLLKRPDGREDVKLVYRSVVAELFPLLAKMLPPGGELLSFVDYTASRQLQQRELLRQPPPPGVPSNLIFTLADDNVGVLPQLATGSLHELMKELRAHGWGGFYTRYWTVGDLDPTVHYLARASWDADVTPETAYRDLVEPACGTASVEPATAAFRLIEQITKGLDQYGLGFGFPVPGMMTKHAHSGGLSAELKGDHARYRQALAHIREARQRSEPPGHRLMDYFLGRLTFAVRYLDAAEYLGAVARAEQAGDRVQALRAAEDACKAIRDAIEAWAAVASDHGDLGAVALLNEYCCRPIRDKRDTLKKEQ